LADLLRTVVSMKLLQSKRFKKFLLAILAGLILGTIYGWAINPRAPSSSTLSSMRADYKTDYVLMVAEIYKTDNDISAATEALTLLGGTSLLRTVQEALINAQDLNYSQSDMELLAQLALDIQSIENSPTGGKDG